MTTLGPPTPPAAVSTAGAELRPPRNRVERRAITHWTLRSAAIALPLAAAPAVAAFVLEVFSVVPLLRMWLWIAAGALLLTGIAVTLVMPTWRYRVHRWEVTDDAVYTASGWLWHEWRVAPMSRIQTVDTERGPIQRLLGLASLTVTTASAAGPLRIEGLDAGAASELAHQLTEVTQDTPGDAT